MADTRVASEGRDRELL